MFHFSFVYFSNLAPMGLRIIESIFYFQICWYKDNILGSGTERNSSSPIAKGKPCLQDETSGSEWLGISYVLFILNNQLECNGVIQAYHHHYFAYKGTNFLNS